jgi:hypothetical protein
MSGGTPHSDRRFPMRDDSGARSLQANLSRFSELTLFAHDSDTTQVRLDQSHRLQIFASRFATGAK